MAAVALVLTGVVVGVLMQTVQRPFPPAPVCMTGDTGTVATSFPPVTRPPSSSLQ